MEQNMTLLRALCEAHGVSGDEAPVLEVVKQELDRQGIAYQQLPFGDLVCGKLDEPEVLLGAHVDEVGFQVSQVHANGTLGVTNLGWVKPHLMNERTVYVQTLAGERVPGQAFASVGMLEPQVPSFAEIFIDVGVDSPEAVAALGVKVGDTGTYQKQFWTTDDAVFASSLDNRLGVYGVLEWLRSNRGLLDRVAVSIHTHEELDFEGLRGVVAMVKPRFALLADMFPVHHRFGANDRPIEVGQGPAVLYQAGRYVINGPMRRKFEQLPEGQFQKAVVDTGPIEIEPLAIQGNGRTMATNIFYPVRGYHCSVYSVRRPDIERTNQFIGEAVSLFLAS